MLTLFTKIIYSFTAYLIEYNILISNKGNIRWYKIMEGIMKTSLKYSQKGTFYKDLCSIFYKYSIFSGYFWELFWVSYHLMFSLIAWFSTEYPYSKLGMILWKINRGRENVRAASTLITKIIWSSKYNFFKNIKNPAKDLCRVWSCSW